MQLLSVIICTHNPRAEYLGRTLAALKTQTLPLDQWELLIIDNASNRPLAPEVDLSWHPNARHVREERLGLTPARMCGIQSAQAQILIFVDDDNVLDRHYLENVLKLSQDWPMLGAWGGQCLPDFEIEPPEWTKEFWEYLGIRTFDRDRWSNSPYWENTPIGAGLCVRKTVAETYAHSLQNDPRRTNLDRQGNMLLSCGDMDFAYTACDMGLGIGVFKDLKLLHLMPPNRLEESYLLRMVEQSVYSRVMLYFLRGKEADRLSWKEKLKLVLPFRLNPKNWRLAPRERKFKQAREQGYNLAMKAILNQQ
ncbi:glycosyltransferase [Tumidithrix elongata RA019]|uniref:Glycosyltransferase n=1 Tax=Tumidithrix elongata BACA0141 TaxID=2716417 RepID=A0AAW9PV10_9CYAN|nr:glycosyltransferase [Tumidithrix elongata RA019]